MDVVELAVKTIHTLDTLGINSARHEWKWMDYSRKAYDELMRAARAIVDDAGVVVPPAQENITFPVKRLAKDRKHNSIQFKGERSDGSRTPVRNKTRPNG